MCFVLGSLLRLFASLLYQSCPFVLNAEVLILFSYSAYSLRLCTYLSTASRYCSCASLFTCLGLGGKGKGGFFLEGKVK